MKRRFSSTPKADPTDHRLGMSLIPQIPQGGLRDGWEYLKQDRPHRWASLGLAITIPCLIFYFILRSVEPAPLPRQIIYVQSWPADRSEFAVRRDWLNRALQANDENQQRRNAYGALGNAIGQNYDRAGADAEFDEARAQIRQALADLDHAERNGLPLPPLPRRQPEAATAEAPPAAGTGNR